MLLVHAISEIDQTQSDASADRRGYLVVRLAHHRRSYNTQDSPWRYRSCWRMPLIRLADKRRSEGRLTAWCYVSVACGLACAGISTGWSP